MTCRSSEAARQCGPTVNRIPGRVALCAASAGFRPIVTPFYSSRCAGFLNHVFNPMSRRSKKKAPAVRSTAPVSPAGEMPGAAGSRPPESGGRPAGLSDRWTVPGVCIFLAVATWLVFGQTVHYGFINFDDNLYVYENPAVSGGLTLKGIAAMFTHVECNFYHPLTMISLMLNDQLHGLQPGGYHLANVLLHTLSAILLFLVLRGMTGMTWRSAFVAAVFAIHPLHVESVAWVAER